MSSPAAADPAAIAAQISRIVTRRSWFTVGRPTAAPAAVDRGPYGTVGRDDTQQHQSGHPLDGAGRRHQGIDDNGDSEGERRDTKPEGGRFYEIAAVHVAAQVSGPTRPSTLLRDFSAWNCDATCELVGPNMPSAPLEPRSHPRVII